MQEIVEEYDSFVKTGNEAVDVILTEKHLVCQKEGIRFTALIDGKALSFLSESDAYALFGNLLENAIEATKGIEDEQRRVISMTSVMANGFLCLHIENFYDGEIKMVEGVPKTTKSNPYYHGFGVRSVMLIAEKYQGHVDISTSGGIYSCDILFPKRTGEGT